MFGKFSLTSVVVSDVKGATGGMVDELGSLPIKFSVDLSGTGTFSGNRSSGFVTVGVDTNGSNLVLFMSELRETESAIVDPDRSRNWSTCLFHNNSPT